MKQEGSGARERAASDTPRGDIRERLGASMRLPLGTGEVEQVHPAVTHMF